MYDILLLGFYLPSSNSALGFGEAQVIHLLGGLFGYGVSLRGIGLGEKANILGFDVGLEFFEGLRKGSGDLSVAFCVLSWLTRQSNAANLCSISIRRYIIKPYLITNPSIIVH